MIKSLVAAAALAVVATSSMAGQTDIDFTAYIGGQVNGTGSFVGSDANHDGFLTLNELSSFSIDIEGYTGSLSNVNAFGSYDIATNTWNADAEAWNHTYNTGAFVTWENERLSMTTQSGFSVATVSAVPEPASLALMGLGGLVLLVRRRKSA